MQDSDIKRHERLKAALKARNVRFPVADIVKRTNYKSGTASEYMSGKKAISDKFLKEISEVYEINEAFLLSGEGEMLKTSNTKVATHPEPDENDPSTWQEQDTSNLLPRAFAPAAIGVMYILGVSYSTSLFDRRNYAKIRETRPERLELLYEEVEKIIDIMKEREKRKAPHGGGALVN